jgi:hypothetical protein
MMIYDTVHTVAIGLIRRVHGWAGMQVVGRDIKTVYTAGRGSCGNLFKL